MKKKIYEDLTDENLLKKKGLFKGVAIGFGIIFLLVFAVLIYILSEKGLKHVSIATLIPIFLLPVTFVPLLLNLGLLNQEIKSRKL